MNKFWYYAEGDETRGPITFDQLVSILSQLPTPRGVLVWREGFNDWTAAENVREIVERLIRPPPLKPRPSVAASAVPDRDPQGAGGKSFWEKWKTEDQRLWEAGGLDSAADRVGDTVAEPHSAGKKKKWSLWRAALYGFLLGIFTFVLSNTANDSWKADMDWWS